MTPAQRPRRRHLASAAVVVVALVVCAWYALAIRAFHDEGRVTALLSPSVHIDRRQARAAEARLRDAAALNPDLTVDSLLARLYARSGAPGAALTLARELTRREPMNVNTWLLLSYLVAPTDPAAYRGAKAHILMLVPPVPQ